MQINGYQGSHNMDSHQVTGYMHEHPDSKQQGTVGSITNAASQQQSPINTSVEEPNWSLGGWLRSTLANTRRVLLGFWNDGSTGTTEETDQADLPDGSGIVSNEKVVEISQEAAKLVVPLQADISQNPYFQPITETKRQQNHPLHKIKVRFQALTGRFARRFSNRNSFQTKQEQRSKEDLRRYSRFRDEDKEIECILTDDTYLLDSYNSKGEYRKISVKDGK